MLLETIKTIIDEIQIIVMVDNKNNLLKTEEWTVLVDAISKSVEKYADNIITNGSRYLRSSFENAGWVFIINNSKNSSPLKIDMSLGRFMSEISGVAECFPTQQIDVYERRLLKGVNDE